MKPVYTMIGSMLLSSLAFAQQAPPAEAPPPPGERRDGPGPGGPPPPPNVPNRRDRTPPNPDGPPGSPGGFERRPMPGGERGGGFGGGDMGGGGGSDPRMQRFELMRGYLDAVDRYARMAHNPTHAGIAAVVAAGDMLKPRGSDVAIDYFTKLLPEVKSPAVQRAVRLQLVELYKQSGKQDEALTQLKTLMTAEPGADEGKTPPPPR
ncbi:MAG: hypothetical protein ABIP55_07315 [Tepidisphaeraceae bacterium]